MLLPRWEGEGGRSSREFHVDLLSVSGAPRDNYLKVRRPVTWDVRHIDVELRILKAACEEDQGLPMEGSVGRRAAIRQP